MKRRMMVSIVAGILLIGLYWLIFSFSAQDAEESGSLSAFLSEKCAEFWNALSGRHWSDAMIQSMGEYFEHPIRKLAHFGEYAVMGVLVYLIWRPWLQRGKRLYFLILIWVFLSAAADEFHQTFVPGRYGSFTDVMLDTAGGLSGCFVSAWAERLRFLPPHFFS